MNVKAWGIKCGFNASKEFLSAVARGTVIRMEFYQYNNNNNQLHFASSQSVQQIDDKIESDSNT